MTAYNNIQVSNQHDIVFPVLCTCIIKPIMTTYIIFSLFIVCQASNWSIWKQNPLLQDMRKYIYLYLFLHYFFFKNYKDNNSV